MDETRVMLSMLGLVKVLVGNLRMIDGTTEVPV